MLQISLSISHYLSRVKQLSQLPYDPKDKVNPVGTSTSTSRKAGRPTLLSSTHMFLSQGLVFLLSQETEYSTTLSKSLLILTLSIKGRSDPESYLSNTKLNKSSRNQDKSRLPPALCQGPDLPSNREFKIPIGVINPLLA